MTTAEAIATTIIVGHFVEGRHVEPSTIGDALAILAAHRNWSEFGHELFRAMARANIARQQALRACKLAEIAAAGGPPRPTLQ